ncbi:MAG TPA: type II toxin-antitoxin system RelB/DinJ family antitoxin [Erysipelothrix sp.]|nr:type II toxin-antitoxin system RelB/DinJ family antitoxin [Erysipelothrix sp.]
MIVSTKNINIRIEEELKNQAEDLFESLGLTLSAAIKIFLKQSVRESGIPFEVKLNKDTAQAFREVDNDQLEVASSTEDLWSKLKEG